MLMAAVIIYLVPGLLMIMPAAVFLIERRPRAAFLVALLPTVAIAIDAEFNWSFLSYPHPFLGFLTYTAGIAVPAGMLACVVTFIAAARKRAGKFFS